MDAATLNHVTPPSRVVHPCYTTTGDHRTSQQKVARSHQLLGALAKKLASEQQASKQAYRREQEEARAGGRKKKEQPSEKLLVGV